MQHGLYLEDVLSGVVRLTKPGIAILAPRMAAVGIDIRSIRTRDRLTLAIDTLYDYEIRRLAQKARGLHPEIDRILVTLPTPE
ncbi:MAG: hypothetical protein CVV05_00755 [Gammaproteobacteria bacterium HGW-Gammaproteobacteria-1]|jgi:hypothetical protein|nr:MAG: hypothetical protein CVV05_00755 [Gammaproteobacteria bacterium HGW-Gammaproteobacteria-1]